MWYLCIHPGAYKPGAHLFSSKWCKPCYVMKTFTVLFILLIPVSVKVPVSFDCLAILFPLFGASLFLFKLLSLLFLKILFELQCT